MDQHRLTTWKRAFSGVPSRRDVLRGLVGAGLGLCSLRLTDVVAAKDKKQRKQRRRKKQAQAPVTAPSFELPPLVINEFGCIDVGQACRGDSALCCSGTCNGAAPAAGQPDSSRCAAHNTGTCRQQAEGFCTTPAREVTACNNRQDCVCFRTTGGSNFCGIPNTAQCAACQRDADCEVLGFPSKSACLPFSEGRCAGGCSGGMACMAPCDTAPPGP
jgi:hypothetical protein